MQILRFARSRRRLRQGTNQGCKAFGVHFTTIPPISTWRNSFGRMFSARHKIRQCNGEVSETTTLAVARGCVPMNCQVRAIRHYKQTLAAARLSRVASHRSVARTGAGDFLPSGIAPIFSGARAVAGCHRSYWAAVEVARRCISVVRKSHAPVVRWGGRPSTCSKPAKSTDAASPGSGESSAQSR